MFLLYFDIEQKKEYLLFGKNRLKVLFFAILVKAGNMNIIMRNI